MTRVPDDTPHRRFSDELYPDQYVPCHAEEAYDGSFMIGLALLLCAFVIGIWAGILFNVFVVAFPPSRSEAPPRCSNTQVTASEPITAPPSR